jgi:hypothetical protein
MSLLIGDYPTTNSLHSTALTDWIQSQSQSYFTTGGLPPITSSWRQFPWVHDQKLNSWGHSPYVTSFPTREWVCRLQLLVVLASAVILGSESRGTHDHISLSSFNLEGQVPVFISPRTGWPSYIPQAPASLSVTSYVSQGYGGGIRTGLHTGLNCTNLVCGII